MFLSVLKVCLSTDIIVECSEVDCILYVDVVMLFEHANGDKSSQTVTLLSADRLRLTWRKDHKSATYTV